MIDPRTNLIRYIGKTVNPKDRYTNHINQRLVNDAPKDRWIRKLVKQDLKPILKILIKVDEKNWERSEKEFIKHYKQFGNLLNVEEGGYSGCNRNITWGDKISAAKKGAIFTQEHKENLSKSHKGYKMPQTQRDNIGKALSNNPQKHWVKVAKIDIDTKKVLAVYKNIKEADILNKTGGHMGDIVRKQRKIPNRLSAYKFVKIKGRCLL